MPAWGIDDTRTTQTSYLLSLDPVRRFVEHWIFTCCSLQWGWSSVVKRLLSVYLAMGTITIFKSFIRKLCSPREAMYSTLL